ncbi:MAG: GPW/gp25 family protein [Phaeodactylibacter sp.]|nr:GPW/gp25 family protein [Phaeodactylibacter sp.]
MEDNQHKSYLGTGWSFPPAFDKSRKTLELARDVEDIRQSLFILLTTELGERVMIPEYGAGMKRMLFEPLTTNLRAYMTELVRQAVIRYEPRIKLESVIMNDSGELEGRVLIEVEFTVKETNSRANFVFPFYINEGTNI